MSSASLDDLAV